MNKKLIVQALNTGVRYGDTEKRNAHCWAELIFLYEDCTWEKVFEYRWTDPFNVKRLNTGRFTNITREEAIAKLEVEYYKGKLTGVFKD